MKKIQIIILILLPVLFSSEAYTQKKNLTYQEAYGMKRPKVTKPLPRITGWLNDNYYLVSKTVNEHKSIVKVDVKTGKETLYFDYDEQNKKLPDGFSFNRAIKSSDDLKHFLFTKDNNLYYFSVDKGVFKQLTFDDEKENNPTFSPDFSKIAFTRSHDLFVIDISSGKESRLTNDGSDLILNGWASWVYYEEILGRRSRHKAFWWSPDGNMIAYLRFDDSPVPEFLLFNSEGDHGTIERTRYPQPGDPNPLVKLGVIHLESGNTTWINTFEENDRYVAWPFWTNDSKELIYQYLNRDQNELVFYAANPETGKVRNIYTEKQDSWVEFFEDVYVFEDGSGFLLRSDKSGWRNIYYYNFDGKLICQLTDFDWRVTGISKVVEKTNTLFFTGTGGVSTDNQLFSIKLNGKGLKQLTNSTGTHRVVVSPGGKYFFDTYSSILTPPKMELFSSKGKSVRLLGDSKLPAMDDYNWGKVEMFTVPTIDGYELPAMWVLPPDFDPAKKYPVIFTIYGGPNAPSVRNSFRISPGSAYLAENGIITFVVDHRCTGHHGKKGVALMHRNLGKWEMHDYIEAVKWLREKPFIDAEKIGITGGSYGGYATCMALTFGADYFTHGIANFSVTDWKLYDNVYTERYMDTPEQNPEGYKNGSAMTWANQYKGKLLITHGTTDDNVHLLNTLKLIDRFEDLNKEFSLLLYPNKRHGWGGPKRVHLVREQTQFWFRNFLGKELNTDE